MAAALTATAPRLPRTFDGLTLEQATAEVARLLPAEDQRMDRETRTAWWRREIECIHRARACIAKEGTGEGTGFQLWHALRRQVETRVGMEEDRFPLDAPEGGLCPACGRAM